MGKFTLDNEVIKEYLGITREFTSVKDFCDYLYGNEGSTDIKLGLKKMLVRKVLNDDKEEKSAAQKRLFKENVAWVLANCSIKGTAAETAAPDAAGRIQEGTAAARAVIPENDFQKVRDDYENREYELVRKLEEEILDYTDGIVLHEGGVITQQNEYQLYLSGLQSNLELDLSKILIVELEGNKVLALGHMVPDIKEENVYTIVFDNKKCIDYRAFVGISQARFILYTKQGQIYSRTFEMEYKPFAVEKERPLCIDFGTSNTAAGSYGILDKKKDEAEIVKFIDVTVTPNNTEAVLLPTIVYVDDCSDPDHIKYLFGYEARKRIEEEHYESKASVYYEIKRWISSADEREEIRDNHNNKATPMKKEIIKAYIDYVIENAQQYFGTRFKKIHFSAPVKWKEQFIDVFTKLYKDEKQILGVEDSIDEGIAIVYNKIITLMYSGISNENTKKSIMIMDCGGGTTDLASCEYQFKKTDAGVELELDTCFENGNPNFGGNNITYRIMQLLKIKIAAKLSENVIDNMGEAIQLIDKSENEILGLIEGNMNQKSYDSDQADTDIYAKFLDNYNRAEDVIPTQYVDNTKYRGTESLKKVKRNFYYLWRQAEQIKIEFYKTERVLMDFDDAEDAIVNIKSHDNYYLYVAQDGELRKELNPFDKVSITIKEINRVICGDIYSLLVGLFQSGELTSREKNVEDFDYYKLSGQSCKISLFSELIKEYIPGRKFRPAIRQGGGSEKRSSEDLKLDCVLGCINYVKDQIRPEMKVIFHPRLPKLIYNIVLKGYHNDDKKLFDCRDAGTIQMEVSHKNTREYPLAVVAKDGAVERTFIFEARNPGENRAKDTEWTTEEIKSKILDSCSSILTEESVDSFIGKLRETASDKKEAVNIVFAVPAKQGYGVWLGQLQASSTEDGSKYMLLKYEYQNFEDSSKIFFDGHR